MELKHKEKTVISVDARDLGQYLGKKYNTKKPFCLYEEASNDTTHDVDISKEETYFDQEEADEIIQKGGCEYYMMGILLEDAARKGLLKRGNYLVNVSW